MSEDGDRELELAYHLGEWAYATVEGQGQAGEAQLDAAMKAMCAWATANVKPGNLVSMVPIMSQAGTSVYPQSKPVVAVNACATYWKVK